MAFADETTLWLLRLAVSGFLAVLFLQSGWDKVADRAGNMAWLTEHFAASPLAGLVGPMLTTVTVLELAAGVLSLLGGATLLVAGVSSSGELPSPVWSC